jgi:hypothetical protein
MFNSCDWTNRRKSRLLNFIVLGEPLDLSDLLMADNREYRALWARHYLGLEPPYELAQAVNVWRNSSSRAALKAADAAGEALSLLPQEPMPQIRGTRRRCGLNSKAVEVYTAGPG